MGLLALSIAVVAFMTFSMLFALFRKVRPEKTPMKDPLFWVAAVVSTPLMYAALLFTWYKITSTCPEKAFDQNAWLEQEDKRYLYVDDLIESDRLTGLTMEEVAALLGAAESATDSSATYYIGYSPKVFMNGSPDWLEIAFEDGAAVSARIDR